MTCDETKSLLSEYWGHALGETEELEFEAHLAQCESCRGETERLGAIWRNLTLIPSAFPEGDPSPNLRTRFYDTLGAYRQGLESARKHSWKEKLFGWWPKQPAWQMATSFAMLAIGVGVGLGLGMKQDSRDKVVANGEMAQLHEEVNSMRQMVALSLMQQQSAGDRLRGVGYAYRVEPSDTEVLNALLSTVNTDPSVNVRMSAVEALRVFGASPVTQTALAQSVRKQTAPVVQIALIDLLTDLKAKNAVGELRAVTVDESINPAVRERALKAIEKLQPEKIQ